MPMQGYAYAILGKAREKMQTIEGSYTLKQSKLYSASEPQILHIRQRKNIKKPSQTPLFLARHQPSFEYISNLYQQPKGQEQIKPSSYEIQESCTLYLDYKGVEYQLIKSGDNVAINKLESINAGEKQVKELTSV